MNDKANRAISYFNEGKNCAQSVLLAFSEDFDVDPTILESLSLGFGGGMGHLQKTCGAVTGAFMVISLYCSTLDKEVQGQESRRLIQDFHARFIALHGNSDCRSLLDCDLNTHEGQARINELDLKEKVCIPCVESAVVILEDLLNLS
jgi:C_GCAxxG_C_C family probable redox protein